MAEKRVYTLDEIAALLKITKRTIYNYIKGNKLKAVKVGKYWRVTEENLNDFLKRGTNG